MKKILIVTTTITVVLLLLGATCSNGKYSKKELDIDTSFLNVFYSIANNKQLVFINKSREKQFTVSDIDSIIRNNKGGFMGGAAYKNLFFKIHEVGNDTTCLSRENEIFVNKDPLEKRTSLLIQFNNFRFFEDTLPLLNEKNLIINSQHIKNYYLFQTSLQSKQPDDVVELYITLDNGLVAFKTFCGEFWFRKDL